jgi:transcriptional regulator with XRE-family HTH domain
MSLRELARRVGISASALSQIEVGRSGPSVNTLYEIARQLDATPNEIFFGNSSPGTMQVNIHQCHLVRSGPVFFPLFHRMTRRVPVGIAGY